ncbi:hypothetical protein Trco_004886 [Trichoderma cornu-damae]|uniref:Uncharacterized protein n=1 Tax=Trichoderma cornu-damae TaxID=654480 RepID=A0A9P8QMF3_9HYPO|nr:hypothetical protein Trco_004886 [Trichoderma cornu-damae]
MDQLQKENACKSSASDAVDKALENSHKKREEMKKCLEEYRMQADKDIQQKDKVIWELKEKLNHQETLLAQEKLSADNLRAQAEEQTIARQLDSLIAGGNLVASNMLSRDDLELKLSAAENNVIESEQSSEHATSILLQDFTQQFSSHEVKIDHLESRLQQAYEGFTEKIETMVSGALNDGKKTTNLVRGAADELRNTLEQGFGQERERTEKLLLGNEIIVKALTTHIDDHKQQMAAQSDHKTHELQAILESERDAAAQLTRKIQALEQKAQESEVLRIQWLRDVQTAETARSQLKAIQERIPHVEGFDKKLDRLVEINKLIQSSAGFLAEESGWVQKELIGRLPEPIVSEAVVVSRDIYESTQALSIEPDGATESSPPTKEDAAWRKVTVHSPDPMEGSPSPPPTVRQEQKRRREIIQLRSILKSPAPPAAVESGNIEGPSPRPHVTQSKPGHPLNGSLHKTGSASSEEMVAEIRSRMLRHDWSFSTVADFERDIQSAGKKRLASESILMPPELDGTNDWDPKKPRTEHCTE